MVGYHARQRSRAREEFIARYNVEGGGSGVDDDDGGSGGGVATGGVVARGDQDRTTT